MATSKYGTRAGIEGIFGVNNVLKWATLSSGDSDAVILARITLAIDVASEHIDDIIRTTHYVIPLQNRDDDTPVTIVDLANKLAGVWLYEARGTTDFDEKTGRPFHRLASARRDGERTLRDIFRGERKLNAV